MTCFEAVNSEHLNRSVGEGAVFRGDDFKMKNVSNKRPEATATKAVRCAIQVFVDPSNFDKVYSVARAIRIRPQTIVTSKHNELHLSYTDTFS